MASRMLNQSEVARALELHPKSVPGLFRTSSMKVYQVGREKRVILEDLVEYLVATTKAWGLHPGDLKKGTAPTLQLSPNDPNYAAWVTEKEKIRDLILDRLRPLVDDPMNTFIPE